MKMRTGVKIISCVWILTAVLFAGAGCTAAPATPATGQTPAAGEETPELPVTGVNSVEVQLDEFTINMPASIPAGQTVFEVTNAGTEEHSFRIEGQGVEAELERNLQPGETLDLEVDLVQGTYDVFCPVEDHAAEGMQLDLTVTGS